MHKGLQEVHDARIIYLDMNAFFASVEQQNNPELRDRPLAVVSHFAERGTVLAASYEAKALGISTGTRLGEARGLCPDIACVTTNPSAYRDIHERFMIIVKNLCGPEVIAYSIDEAAIQLSPNWYGSERAHQLALLIKEEFRQQLGPYIRCSIGIAPNTSLAKIASNLKKPNGLSEITLANTEQILATLELTDLPGIAYKSYLHLAEKHIYTTLDFYHTPALQLRKWYGMWGQYWWYRLHGYEIETSHEQSKSLSHQHVLTKWISNPHQLEPIISRMSDRLIHRLRHNHFQCRHAWLYLSLVKAPGIFAEIQFDSPTDSYFQLLTTLESLSKSHKKAFSAPVRKVSMGFNLLSPAESGLQLDLFDVKPKQEQLSRAVEHIRDRYGFNAIQLGNIVTLDTSVAKEQLGFGRIRDRFTRENASN